jgi:uncharacterized protein YpuA (DUF1002 family)
MQSKQFKDLTSTAFSVLAPKNNTPVAKQTQLNESVQVLSEHEEMLINEISDILEKVEGQLGIKLTDSEIQESTSFIIKFAQLNSIVESVENEVGFKLNEDEINYVLNKLITE